MGSNSNKWVNINLTCVIQKKKKYIKFCLGEGVLGSLTGLSRGMKSWSHAKSSNSNEGVNINLITNY